MESTTRTKTRAAWNGQERWQNGLAKHWGETVCNYRNRGGYIYGQNAIEREGRLTSHSRYTGFQGWGVLYAAHRVQILDHLTRELTAARSFEELLATEPCNTYRPTISASRNWRYAALAEAYDEAQARRHDPRRAYRI